MANTEGSTTILPNYTPIALGNVGISVNVKKMSDKSGKCVSFGTSVDY